MVKGVGAMIFQFILPSIQVILFCIAIGKDPQHIHMGVINQDTYAGPLPIPANITAASTLQQQPQQQLYRAAGMPHALGGDGAGLFLPDWSAAASAGLWKRQLQSAASTAEPLASNFLSTEFLGELDRHFIMRSFSSVSEARAAVDTNDVWGYVHVPVNFTLNTLARVAVTALSPLTPLSNATLQHSTLRYTLDMSNEQMTIYLIKSVAQAYSALLDKYAPGLAALAPLQMDEPVYGDANANFTDFVAPGIIITIGQATASAALVGYHVRGCVGLFIAVLNRSHVSLLLSGPVSSPSCDLPPLPQPSVVPSV